MNLGLLLNIGESLTSLKASGQDKRLVDYYLKTYTKNFDKVYLFSFTKEKYPLPKNSVLISNQAKLHRFIYTFLMPIFHFREFKKCDSLRVTHLLGSIPAIIAKIFYGKKFVVTYGYDYKEFARIEGKSYLKPLISFIEFLNLKLADGIIVTNRQIQTYVASRVEKDKVFFIPNGVDVRLFKPNSKLKKSDSYGMQNSKFKILFIGRLERQKNLFVLIKAISLLKNRKNILLQFVGDGSLRNELIRHARDLKANLRIIKRVPHNKMPQIYQQADIFVLPSLIEGHPKVLLEALSCGLPCIVNNIETTQEIIKEGETGFFFEGEPEDLARKIKMVFTSTNKRKIEKMKKEARELILAKYDLNKLIDKEIALLKKV